MIPNMVPMGNMRLISDFPGTHLLVCQNIFYSEAKKSRLFHYFAGTGDVSKKKTHTSPREALPWSLQGTPIQKSLL